MLVSEVMLHQTQVPRVEDAWPRFIAEFPTPDAMAAAGPGAVITGVGPPRLPAPGPPPLGGRGHDRDRRLARRPHRAAGRRSLHRRRDRRPGRRRRRPRGRGERPAGGRARAPGTRSAEREAEAAMVVLGAPAAGRDRLLALMDVGALLCRPATPKCDRVPVAAAVRVTWSAPGRGAVAPTRVRRIVPATPRSGDGPPARGRPGPGRRARSPTRSTSLVADGLAVVHGADAALP